MTSDGRAESPSRARLAYLCAIAGATLAILEVNKLNLALPAIRSSLGAGDIALQLIIAAYALGFGLSLVPFGRVGDAWSKRRVLVIGVVALGAASAAGAFAPTGEVLVVMRFVEGIAAGLILPQTTGIMQDLFSGAALARAYGGFGAVVGTASLVAPSIGGAFLALLGNDLGWRAMMIANVPICVLVAIGGWFFLSENAEKGKPLSPDAVGLTLLGLGVTALMAPLLAPPEQPLIALLGWSIALCGVVLLALFAVWERRYERSGHDPIMSVALFRNVPFRAGAIVGALFFLAMPGTHLVLGIFLQDSLGLSALGAALVLIFAAAASTASAWFGSRLSFRYGRYVIIVGLAIVALGLMGTTLASFAAANEPRMVVLIAAAQVLVGAGGGLVTAPNQSLAMAAVERSRSSSAGSVFQLGQRLGTAVGSSAALFLLFHATTLTGTLGSNPAWVLVPTAALTTTVLVCAIAISAWETAAARSPETGTGGLAEA